MSNKKVSYAKNIQSINLITNKERVGKLNFYPSVIENTIIYKQDIEMSENDIKNCRLTFRSNDNCLAEREGFEPSRPFPALTP